MTKTPAFETQWSYSLDYGPPDAPHRSGMCGGKDTQGATIADMFKMATYYLGLGYIVSAKLDEHCKVCHGTGTKPKRGGRLYQFVKCSACKGRKPSETIDCGRFGLSQGVTIHNDAI